MAVSLRRWVLPADASSDAGLLLAARGLRGFVDGLISVLLASYLTDLGFSPTEIGVLITGTLLGSAALTLGVGLYGGWISPRRILLFACLLMLATGLGFAGVTSFWPLLVVAIAGTLNPSNGDVSLFLPTEQALLTGTVGAAGRTALFARYNLSGTFCGALGALASGVPVLLAKREGWDLVDAQRSGFVLYACVAVLVAILYSRLSPSVEPESRTRSAPLAQSRKLVLRLSALFSMDSFGGGFVVQALLALWLYQRFGMSVATAGLQSLPLQRLPHTRRLHAERAPGSSIHSHAHLPVTDGRARAPVLCDGDGAARRARFGSQRHQRPAQPGCCFRARPGRLPAQSNDVRLAAGRRRHRQTPL